MKNIKNKLAATNSNLATEWHPTKNGDLTPAQVSEYSHKKVWWLGKCGHEWEARIEDRNNGGGCRICSKRGRKPKN